MTLETNATVADVGYIAVGPDALSEAIRNGASLVATFVAKTGEHVITAFVLRKAPVTIVTTSNP